MPGRRVPSAKLRAAGPVIFPKHVGIIMDGNRRWGQQRGLPSRDAYLEGCRVFDRIVRRSAERGVRNLTCFAFSTENWSRPAEEIVELYDIFSAYIAGFIERRRADPELGAIRLRILGSRSGTGERFSALAGHLDSLPVGPQVACVVNVAINYGARADIVQAVRALVCEGGTTIDEPTLGGRLCTTGLPDLDLVIRTGGEMRLSNFMLWEAAFAELFFEDCLWPDFTLERFEACLRQFEYRRTRPDLRDAV